MKQRIEEIDIIKALGIICMVAGHSSAPFSHFVNLFHMAIFFITSGFLFKDYTSENIYAVMKAIKSKIRQLWIPFFVTNMVYVLLHNPFITLNIYTSNEAITEYVTGNYIGIINLYSNQDIVKRVIGGLFFITREQMFGAAWFLKILFMISVGYLIVDFIGKKFFSKSVLIIQLLVSSILLGCGYICSIWRETFYGIALFASYYCLYYMGYLLRLCKEKIKEIGWKKQLIVGVVSFGILLILNTFGSVSLLNNSYENPLFLLAASISGCFFLFSFSFFIKNIYYIKALLLEIGRRTMIVVILHFLSFKIIEVIVTWLYGLPIFCVAAFPNLYGERGMWWLLYTVAGVGVPVLVSIMWHRFMLLFRNLIHAIILPENIHG